MSRSIHRGMQVAHPLIVIGGSLLFAPLALPATSASPPALMLANQFDAADINLADYWISEKYDGIRAYWTGEALLTRNGNPIHAPAWFTADWPQQPLDGELWIGRGQFESVVSTVRDQIPDNAAWRQVHFMTFDLPAHPGTFDHRLKKLNSLLAERQISWLRPVAQFLIADRPTLKVHLKAITAAGGEGLMLHRRDSHYRGLRSDDLLKLKPYQDAEAQVIGHVPGKGKYAGMMGALKLRRPDAVQFRLGTGFSDAQRLHPPAVGTWITYSYQELTAQGKPRFARFIRECPKDESRDAQ